eukprot:scaffold3199_cov165-Amphora_coffeaeformis.AAC.17
MWIADTGTTVHNTPHGEGIKGNKAENGESVTMCNGQAENANVIGNLSGMMREKEGNQVGPGKLERVSVIPNGKFNLFSVTRMMIKGWKLRGDDSALWLEKDGQRVVFDIKIPIKEGRGRHVVCHVFPTQRDRNCGNNSR